MDGIIYKKMDELTEENEYLKREIDKLAAEVLYLKKYLVDGDNMCARCNNKAEVTIETEEKKDLYDCTLQQYLKVCRECAREGEKVVE